MDLEKYKDKSGWLDEFCSQRPDLFFSEDLSDSDRAEAVEMIRPSRLKAAMYSSIPMTCRAEKCPAANVCPLLKKGWAPKGEKCPIELRMVQTFMRNYFEELNIDEDSMTEVSQVRDLVDLEIQQFRVSNKLSQEDFIQEVVVGVNERTGEPIMKPELHQAVEMQSRVIKHKADIRKQLIATREGKSKTGQGQLDTAQALAEIFTQVRELDVEREKLLHRKLNPASDLTDYIQDAEVIEDDA